MDRRNPLEDVQELIERMNRGVAGEGGSLLGEFDSAAGHPPEADVVERDDEFVVTVDVPGFEPADVTARVTGRTIEVDAEREASAEASEDDYLRKERRHRSVSRRIRLPRSIDADAVEGTLNNGVLTLRVPKASPASEGHQIDIS